MRLLVDTHVFLWWLSGSKKLGPRATASIADPANAVYVSAATAWEIAVKQAAGRLVAPGDIENWITDGGFLELSVEVAHAVAAAELPPHHADPFDRLIVAQALLDDLALVTSDDQLSAYGGRVVAAAL